jgi:hypothetical protein
MEIGFHTFPSGKQYVYVKEPAKEKRVFLRNIIFLCRAHDPATFAVVREWQASTDHAVWEPPKGQMEWKELKDSGVRAGSTITPPELAKHMRAGVLREMMEEAKILPSEIRNLSMVPVEYTQAWPESGVRGAHFRYQFWKAIVTDSTMLEAQKRMKELVNNPEWALLLPPDMCEKDAIVWWSPEKDSWKMIRGEFSQKMTHMFVDWAKGHGI